MVSTIKIMHSFNFIAFIYTQGMWDTLYAWNSFVWIDSRANNCRGSLSEYKTVTSCPKQKLITGNLLQQTSLWRVRHRQSKLLHSRKRWMREGKACIPHSLWSPPFSTSNFTLNDRTKWGVEATVLHETHAVLIYINLTIAERGEAYAIILKTTHSKPATAILISPCSRNWVIKTAAAGNPTSKIATSMAVLA